MTDDELRELLQGVLIAIHEVLDEDAAMRIETAIRSRRAWDS